MSPVLRRASLRHYRRHPLQAALAILGIALGVAVVVSVDLATASARRAFELSTEAAFGRTTHQIVAGPGGIPDTEYRRLRVGLNAVAAPIVDVRVRIAGPAAGRSLTLLGIDPFAEAPFRPYADAGAGSLDIAALLTRPGALVLPADVATDLGVATGDSVIVEIAGEQRVAWVAGLITRTDALSRRAIADLALADIATAQELAGRVGRIDRIDLVLRGTGEVERVRAALPAGTQLVETGARTAATQGMTRAFTLNLTAFTLIVLVFGALLIYDTMTFSVVQRRPLIGLLRAMGVTRREISRLLLGEALAFGIVATLLGIGFGVVLGAGLVRLVARTINDLYYAVSVTGVTLSAWSFAKGIALGIGATLLAAIPPVREATATVPRLTLTRSILEERARGMAGRAAWGAAVMLLAALGFLGLPGNSVGAGFTALFAVVVAGALLAPAGTLLLMRGVRPAATKAFGVAGSIAVRSVSAALSRTGPAIAALMVAIAVGAAVGIMVGSFRHSVERWLDTSLQADLYVASPSPGSRGEGTLPAGTAERVAALPGVRGVSTLRQTAIPFRAGELTLVAARLDPEHRRSFTFLEAVTDPWNAFDRGGILVSESFAFRNLVKAGDSVTLIAGRGAQSFPVAGVFRDYASEFGVVFVARSIYDQWWDDPAVSSLAVFLEPAANADALAARVRSQGSGAVGRELFVRSNIGLRDATLEVFDRTFIITGVLRGLALIVAFVGVLSSLMALQLERSRELGVLRATGVTPGQLWAIVSTQTGLMGLSAGVLAAPLSIALAWLLIHVINRRSFGWTLDMRIDAAGMIEAIALALLAALLAGAWPAWRMARTSPSVALREE